jgi:hypothetical protein
MTKIKRIQIISSVVNSFMFSILVSRLTIFLIFKIINMERNNQITFDSLGSDTLPPELVNQNFYETRDFLELYYAKFKKFPAAEEKKNEYLKWHKQYGQELYDKDTGIFKPNKSIKDKLLFLKIHPFLTLKDNKNLVLLKVNLAEKHRRMFLFEFISGICLFATYIRVRYGKNGVKNYAKNNKLKIFLLTIINIFAFDILFSRFMKHRYIDSILEEKGMKKKYFVDYLI